MPERPCERLPPSLNRHCGLSSGVEVGFDVRIREIHVEQGNAMQWNCNLGTRTAVDLLIVPMILHMTRLSMMIIFAQRLGYNMCGYK